MTHDLFHPVKNKFVLFIQMHGNIDINARYPAPAQIIGAGVQRGPGLDFVVLGIARIQGLVQSGAIAVQG